MRLNISPILVTGGTGFIGSHVVEQVVQSGSHVVVPFRSIDPRSYFQTQRLWEKATLVSCDITDERRIYDLVSSFRISTIIHLAAQAIVGTAYDNPIFTLNTNIMGTAYILEAARRFDHVKTVVIASSDKAYGKKARAYKETDPLRGDHPYEASKSGADILASMYHKTYGVPVIIARMGNTYGPGDLHEDRIIPGMLKSICTGRELKLRSDGTFVREYVYVKDVADAILFLVSKRSQTIGQAFNISSGQEYEVIELIKSVSTILRKPIPYTIVNDQKNEIPHQALDCAKIRTLGWKPRWTFRRGIQETYAWYRDNSPNR